ncbi:hypothetical protein EV215_0841 [Hypnocyclicus thermotrophus]|uniref:Uncharacterized protein n=1 Tax=Hypnocyclicus thermotrophus TaxID=1627895 RepID=A0AA46DZ88_9FUSO|nr:DUF6485 family protein [Hypnocyclicus thermotrophus]TDT71466.1 hypothetical protein EV215_0841 [Hypnocyclicus thermotrophus]
MSNHFCNCVDTECKFNPKNGFINNCDLCIQKNLKYREIPACFFKLIKKELTDINDFSIENFAKLVMSKKKDKKQD